MDKIRKNYSLPSLTHPTDAPKENPLPQGSSDTNTSSAQSIQGAVAVPASKEPKQEEKQQLRLRLTPRLIEFRWKCRNQKNIINSQTPDETRLSHAAPCIKNGC